MTHEYACVCNTLRRRKFSFKTQKDRKLPFIQSLCQIHKNDENMDFKYKVQNFRFNGLNLVYQIWRSAISDQIRQLALEVLELRSTRRMVGIDSNSPRSVAVNCTLKTILSWEEDRSSALTEATSSCSVPSTTSSSNWTGPPWMLSTLLSISKPYFLF